MRLSAPPSGGEPDNLASQLGLTSHGTVTYVIQTRAPGEKRLITIDSTGAIVARFGPAGEGPGEVAVGAKVYGAPGTVIVVSSARIQIFDPNGGLKSERTGLSLPGFVLAVVGDSLDYVDGVYQVPPRPANPVAILRQCMMSQCQRTMFEKTNSILDSVQRSRPEKADLKWPPYAATGDRVALGDGSRYHIWVFGSDGVPQYAFGRDLPLRFETAREVATNIALSRLRAMKGGGVPGKIQGRTDQTPRHLPHFEFRGLAFDEHHRLWVIGNANDSTFLDVYQDSTFLGRRMIDCQRTGGQAPALQGRWIAMSCDEDERTGEPLRIRLFRIVEPISN